MNLLLYLIKEKTTNEIRELVYYYTEFMLQNNDTKIIYLFV
jgi:hypothetical protein